MQHPIIPSDETPLPLPENEAAHNPHPPSHTALLLTWLRIGAFSFGGGAATLFLLRREFVQRHRWITGDQYNEAFALSKLTPGTNLIAQSILLGRMMAGTPGIVIALVGLMGPAVIVTVLLAALVGYVQQNHIAEAMLAGIVPAAGGLIFAIVIQMGGGQLSQGWRRFRDLIVMICCGALFGLLHVPVPFVLLGAGVIGAIFPRLTDPGVPPPTATTSTQPAPVAEEARQA